MKKEKKKDLGLGGYDSMNIHLVDLSALSANGRRL